MKSHRHGRQSELKQSLHDRIGECASRGHYRRALEMLDHVIEDPLPLFQGEDWVIKERRLAWLFNFMKVIHTRGARRTSGTRPGRKGVTDRHTLATPLQSG